jgi:uncharacterized membrane protein
VHDETRGVRSKAHLMGHPIHPMFIPFPIAFLAGALVTDVVYLMREELLWAQFSYWLILAGIVTGAAAALFGLIDFVAIERARRHRAGWIHFIGNAFVLILALVNLLLRNPAGSEGVVPLGIILSAIIALLLAVTGWSGGELSFRHKIGVIESDE